MGMASTSLFIFTEEMIIQKKGKTKASPSTTITQVQDHPRDASPSSDSSSPQAPTVPDLNSRSWISEKTSMVRKNSTEMAEA